jgi:hypothetical protein
MKTKKNKDLESALVNDLLEEEIVVESHDPNESAPSFPDDKSAVDKTIKLSDSKVVPTALDLSGAPHPTKSSLSFNSPSRTGVTERFAIRAGGLSGGADASLAMSESVRVAQQRIFELEQEIERLRIENEQLAAAGETLRKRADELQADNELKATKLVDTKERLESEREILETSLKAKDRDLTELQLKNQEFEMRLSTNLQKIRVRERELENRLELVKMESTAVVRSKDELILDLKRQIDQLSIELDNYRAKGQELNRQVVEKQEMLRRTVKALRLALSMLEGGSDDQGGKKAAG